MVTTAGRAVARFKDLCLDAVDPVQTGAFWARVLDFTPAPTAETVDRLIGPTPGHTVWINRVAEPKEFKHRVHLDIYTRALSELTALGAQVLVPPGGSRRWTVMTDPPGGEFCAFVRAESPRQRLHGLVVDSTDATAIADWWSGVLGGEVVRGNEFCVFAEPR